MNVRRGPSSITANDVRSWLRAHRRVRGGRRDFQAWIDNIGADTDINEEVLFEIACCYEQFDDRFPKPPGDVLSDGELDEAAIVAAVCSEVCEWIQKQEANR